MPIRQDNMAVDIAPELMTAFERTVSRERWRTYRLAAGFHDETALRLYLWNIAIGQSFHFPLQTVEVAIRNVIHNSLKELHGTNWAANAECRHLLGSRSVHDIIKSERHHRNKYGNEASTSQIVASLSLGFWISLLRQSYHKTIWERQHLQAFPHLLPNETMINVSNVGSKIHGLRNRIFHQEPLIRHDLSQDYAAILTMLGWICPVTKNWVRSLSSVPKIIRVRPRRK